MPQQGAAPLAPLTRLSLHTHKNSIPAFGVCTIFAGFHFIREVIPIAIYHCNISIVSRGKGKSAVAAAAYRSGEKLTNEWDGMTHDYTRKGGVVHTEIMLPPHAPPSFSDRSTLWNSVELYEKAGNAQLAREIDAALPIELSREEQIRLVREYCSSQFVSRGMCVDYAIHDTGKGNPHCHIMLMTNDPSMTITSTIPAPEVSDSTSREGKTIPFKYSKEDAVKALKEHCVGKIFLPKSFTNENHIQKIQGIYVPFWMFDGEAEGDAHYQATRSRTYTSGDYEITETRHFDVYRAGRVTFEKVPVDASSKMPDDHMDSIEPYDYKKLKPFSTAYLPGYLADKFDVTVEQSRERADQRCQGTLDAALRSSVRGYDTCIQTGGSSSLQRGKVHYALMPVWMLNTKWHGKDFTFAMNGQTGKLVGDLPMSWGRFWGLFAAIAAPLSILGTIVSVLMLR